MASGTGPGGGSLLPPILNPTSLYNEEARRDATRIRIYNNVLQHIYNKIKAIARIPGNERSLWYVVPEFIPGTPRFDVKDCIVYLVWNLRNAGYTVDYTHPNLMFISWQKHDTAYRERESPWAQVLGAAREQVLSSATNTAVAPPRAAAAAASATRPRTATAIPTTVFPTSFLSPSPMTSATYESETKRKTVLKKTSEYRPVSAAVGTQAGSDGGSGTLSGTLPTRHVSFV